MKKNNITDQVMGQTLYVRPQTQRGNNERIIEMVKQIFKILRNVEMFWLNIEKEMLTPTTRGSLTPSLNLSLQNFAVF